MNRSLTARNGQEVLPTSRNLELKSIEQSIGRAGTWPYVLFGIVVLIGLLGGFGAWAITAKLNGAIIAPAEFAVKSNRKTVQHLEGGIVDKILIAEGDRVSAGQVLIRLDGTIEQSRYDVLTNELEELKARRIRLLAELRDHPKLIVPAQVLGETSDQRQVDIINGQQQLFSARLRSRNSEQRVRMNRKRSLRDEIDGTTRQIRSNGKQIKIIEQELRGLRKLARRGLVQRRRLLALEREAERIRGQSEALNVNIARARNSIEEIELEGIQSRDRFKEQVTTELRTVGPKIIQISEEWIAAQQKLAQVDIRAPADGHVVALKIHTRGGVIRAGDAVMDIVPEGEQLIIEARLSTVDIDKIKNGQSARVQLTAFDQAVTPEAVAEVLSVSADRLKDERSGESYFLTRLALSRDQPTAVADLTLVPGMPATVFIETGSRTPLSYLLEPLSLRLSRVFADG